MTLTALTGRAKNRLREHNLKVARSGIFQGQQEILTRCTDPNCEWTGWFTDTEMHHVEPWIARPKR